MFKLKIKLVFSIFFFTAYFSLLGAVLYVEASDTLNMKTGENSMMDVLQILLGVLTAGVAQILNFWFGNQQSDIEEISDKEKEKEVEKVKEVEKEPKQELDHDTNPYPVRTPETLVKTNPDSFYDER